MITSTDFHIIFKLKIELTVTPTNHNYNFRKNKKRKLYNYIQNYINLYQQVIKSKITSFHNYYHLQFVHH